MDESKKAGLPLVLKLLSIPILGLYLWSGSRLCDEGWLADVTAVAIAGFLAIWLSAFYSQLRLSNMGSAIFALPQGSLSPLEEWARDITEWCGFGVLMIIPFYMLFIAQKCDTDHVFNVHRVIDAAIVFSR
ncbi:MAG: hypothetical protein A2Z83_07960 [Omnitrophica bacterium GWA2_52_8]|nr:MAG: hypothetical protein A2Z83_07960 [Omnitrophica bacterium GWA2_52_8]